ncbi:MAG: hypothetical protein U5L00_02950 [Desulfovermiculus sp.]|nr:hypothetical protein [Desulfovermiculus sp.]
MRRCRSLSLTLIVLLFPTMLLAAPKADLWEYWDEHNPNSTLTVDHSAWTNFLQRYVSQGPNGVSRLDYQGVTAQDRSSLDNCGQTHGY